MDTVASGDGSKPRPGFYDKPVKIMSIVVIVLGIASFGLGAYILVYALTSMCTYVEDGFYSPLNYDYDWKTSTTTTTTTTERTYKARCRFYVTYFSPGLWGGAMFIASGIIGVTTANRKSTCFILTLMIMSLTTAVTAACSATASIVGNFDYMGGTTYPLSLHIASSFNALLSLISLVLSLIKFGFASRAVCCNGNIGIPKIVRSGYKPLPNQPAMLAPMMSNQPSMPAPMMSYLPPAQQQTSDQAPSQVPMPVFQQGNQPNNAAQPVYLVQGHQIIGMLSPSMQMMTANVAQTPGPSVPPPGDASQQAEKQS